MKYLLDTCVVSELRKPTCSAKVLDWFASIKLAEVYIPAVVLGELQKGIASLDVGGKKVALQQWLDGLVKTFASRIVDFDSEAAFVWGRRFAELAKVGKTPAVVDSQIAATAIANDMMLITRNVDDMVGMSPRIYNPF